MKIAIFGLSVLALDCNFASTIKLKVKEMEIKTFTLMAILLVSSLNVFSKNP